MPPYLEREVRAEQVPGTRKTELLGFTVPPPSPGLEMGVGEGFPYYLSISSAVTKATKR